MTDDRQQPQASPRDKPSTTIFDRIHRSPRIPDRYADRRAVSR